MRTFQDGEGRSWTITVNVSSIKRVRSLLEVDLLTAVDGQLLEQLATDPVLLADVVYCLCKPEADARELSDEQFGEAMAGDAIGDATTALLEGLVEFFPLEKRRLLAKALKKLKTFEAKVLKAAELRLDSPELEAQLEAALTLGNSSGSSLESSESIPVP